MKKIISALLILTMIFSVVCVSTSAAGVTYINMNFESMEAFTNQFIAGAFYVEDGLLFGYAEAKALQTKYADPDGYFDNTLQTWLTYDASITFSIGDDELSDTERFVNLVYCNDNLVYEGREEDRLMMAFSYDVQDECFRLSRGWNNREADAQYLEPVYMSMPSEAEEFVTMGISVTKGNIRCFYEGELIFNLVDASNDLLISHDRHSPFLFWQDGNFIQISNITVTEHGATYPVSADTPVVPDVTEGPIGTSAPADDDEPSYTDEEPVASGDDAPVASGDDAPVASGDDAPVASGDDAPVASGDDAPVASDNTPDASNNAGNNGTAATNQNRPQGGNSATTGDTAFVVVAAMVAALGAAIIVKKVSVK